VQAARRVYATSLRGAVAKCALLSGVYLLGYAAAVLVTLALIILLRF
jgi:hypothetical protein